MAAPTVTLSGASRSCRRNAAAPRPTSRGAVEEGVVATYRRLVEDDPRVRARVSLDSGTFAVYRIGDEGAEESIDVTVPDFARQAAAAARTAVAERLTGIERRRILGEGVEPARRAARSPSSSGRLGSICVPRRRRCPGDAAARGADPRGAAGDSRPRQGGDRRGAPAWPRCAGGRLALAPAARAATDGAGGPRADVAGPGGDPSRSHQRDPGRRTKVGGSMRPTATSIPRGRASAETGSASARSRPSLARSRSRSSRGLPIRRPSS